MTARPWLERAAHLRHLETPFRAAAAAPVTGPLPMLLTATADLTGQLARPIDQVTRAWKNRDPAVPVERWELAHVPDDWWRQTDSTGVAVHRLSTLLASLQA